MAPHRTPQGVRRGAEPHTRGRVCSPCRGAGFTLVELLLVMLLLAVVLAYAAPSLSRFTNRRTLEDEAARLLALIRYAQTEAVTSGWPETVWLDPQEGCYGLEPPPGQSADRAEAEDRFTDHRLPRHLRLTTVDSPAGGGEPRPRMVFHPDGTLGEGAPEMLILEDTRADERLYVVRSENELTYEILTPRAYAMRLEQRSRAAAPPLP